MYPRRAVIFEEQWTFITQDVVPYIIENCYLVSTYGRVYSLATNKYLILVVDKDGYTLCNLHLVKDNPYNRKVDQESVRVNRLVLATFAPIDGWQNLECNHKDSVRSNNYLYNLEWVTSKENHQHGLDFGYKEIPDIVGINNPCAVFTNDQVLEIADGINNERYHSMKEIAEKYNVSESAVYGVIYKKSWSHLNYDIDMEKLPHSTRLFNKEEINQICKFFEDNDINNYKSKNELFRQCLSYTGLDKKVNLESARKSMGKILDRTSNVYKYTIQKYNYQYKK